MEQERLRKMIKAMYLLKDILIKKNEDDVAFKIRPKAKVVRDVQDIINLSLEEFYTART